MKSDRWPKFKERYKGGVRLCGVPGCPKQHFGRGLCAMHRQRMRRYGRIERIRKEKKD